MAMTDPDSAPPSATPWYTSWYSLPQTRRRTHPDTARPGTGRGLPFHLPSLLPCLGRRAVTLHLCVILAAACE